MPISFAPPVATSRRLSRIELVAIVSAETCDWSFSSINCHATAILLVQQNDYFVAAPSSGEKIHKLSRQCIFGVYKGFATDVISIIILPQRGGTKQSCPVPLLEEEVVVFAESTTVPESGEEVVVCACDSLSANSVNCRVFFWNGFHI